MRRHQLRTGARCRGAQSWFGVSEYARSGTYLMGRMRSHPLLLKLGKGEAPEMRQSNYEDPLMLELDDGFRDVQRHFGAELYKAADWRCAPRAGAGARPLRTLRAPAHGALQRRQLPNGGRRARRPFIWKGDVYLGHWIGFRPAQERMALAVLDEEAGLVRYVHRFSHLSGAIEAAAHADGVAPAAKAESASVERGVDFKREKNWGFVAEGERLLIFYALLPCTVVLEFDAGAADGVRLAHRACFAHGAAATLEHTGASRGLAAAARARLTGCCRAARPHDSAPACSSASPCERMGKTCALAGRAGHPAPPHARQRQPRALGHRARRRPPRAAVHAARQAGRLCALGGAHRPRDAPRDARLCRAGHQGTRLPQRGAPRAPPRPP